MKIKNYTSTVPSERSRARIQQVLVELGATQIGMDVSDGRVRAQLSARQGGLMAITQEAGK